MEHAVRRLTSRRVAIAAFCALLGATSPYAGAAPAQRASGATGLQPVELPDVSRMHPGVQDQLQEAYAALRRLDPGLAESEDERAARAWEPATRAARSAAYGNLGKLLLAGEYLDAAERCFRNAWLLARDEFQWPYYLGRLFMKKGDLGMAGAYLEQTRRLRPGDLPALAWLGHVYIELGRPELAVPILTETQALHPGVEAVAYEMGRAALALDDFSGAVEHLEAVLRMNPGATVAHYPLAMAYRGLGDLERAQAHLDPGGGRTDAGYAAGAAVTLPDPLMAEVNSLLRSPQSHRDLGLQASAGGDWPEAVRQFRQAVALAPENAAMRQNLGTALIRAGDARDALIELEEAVRLDGRLAGAHYLLGTLLERSGRDQEAIDRYDAAVARDPNLDAGHLRLADALRRTGRLEASLARYRRILDLAEARFGEALALARLGRHRMASERLRAGMQLHPDQPAFPHALARLLAAAPDPDVRDGPRALELAQTVAREHRTAGVAETLAMAFAELGRFEEAVEWQRFAMTIAADSARRDVSRAMSVNLARYQRGEPCRTPWRDDEPEYNPGPDVDPRLLDPPPAF